MRQPSTEGRRMRRITSTERRGLAVMSKEPSRTFERLDRPPALTARVEQMLRQAIQEGQFVGNRLPTEIELAKQLGVSRETVRLAAENLQREGLVVKIRRKGTFLQAPALAERIEVPAPMCFGYLQAGYPAGPGQEEVVTRLVSAQMLQGAVEAAGSANYRLLVEHAPYTRISQTLQRMHQEQLGAHRGKERRRAVEVDVAAMAGETRWVRPLKP